MSISIVGSSHTVSARPLREYVARLFAGLAAADSAAAARIRNIVGKRRARITLDEESVDVFFDRGRLRAVAATGNPVDGIGRTSRQTTLDLIDGYVEVTAAVLDGKLELTGTADAVVRMATVLELLIDGATRAPALPQLARDFRNDPARPSPAARAAGPLGRAVRFYPAPPGAGERAVLARCDLLP